MLAALCDRNRFRNHFRKGRPMNIEAIAREAGFTVYEAIHEIHGPKECTDELERFAALVRAQAREEAARVCETAYRTDEEHARTGPSFASAIRAIAATKQQAQP